MLHSVLFVVSAACPLQTIPEKKIQLTSKAAKMTIVKCFVALQGFVEIGQPDTNPICVENKIKMKK